MDPDEWALEDVVNHVSVVLRQEMGRDFEEEAEQRHTLTETLSQLGLGYRSNPMLYLLPSRDQQHTNRPAYGKGGPPRGGEARV